MARLGRKVLLKYPFPLHHTHAVGGGFDNIGEHPARFHFLEHFADDVLRVVAPLGGSDERVFFFEFFNECFEPGVRRVERELPFALGAVDEELFPVGALVKGDLGDT